MSSEKSTSKAKKKKKDKKELDANDIAIGNLAGMAISRFLRK